jgi:hypothetical protein
MASVSRLIVLALASCGLALVGASAGGCGVEPVGLDACRKIEEARCDQAPRCPGDLKVTDVAACKRFYRDQCLHGLPIEADPGAPVIDKCVLAIQTAGACTLEQSACVAVTRPVANGCDIVKSPEVALDCAFLIPPPAAATATPAATDDAGADAADASEDGMM